MTRVARGALIAELILNSLRPIKYEKSVIVAGLSGAYPIYDFIEGMGRVFEAIRDFVPFDGYGQIDGELDSVSKSLQKYEVRSRIDFWTDVFDIVHSDGTLLTDDEMDDMLLGDLAQVRYREQYKRYLIEYPIYEKYFYIKGMPLPLPALADIEKIKRLTFFQERVKHNAYDRLGFFPLVSSRKLEPIKTYYGVNVRQIWKQPIP